MNRCCRSAVLFSVTTKLQTHVIMVSVRANLEDFVELFQFSSSGTCQKIINLADALLLHSASNVKTLFNCSTCCHARTYCLALSFAKTIQKTVHILHHISNCKVSQYAMYNSSNGNKVHLCCAPYSATRIYSVIIN